MNQESGLRLKIRLRSPFRPQIKINKRLHERSLVDVRLFYVKGMLKGTETLNSGKRGMNWVGKDQN